MKKKLKIVFFGTPDFAASVLEAIQKSQHEVLGVVTVEDKQSGRGLKVNESAVKQMAKIHHLPLFQPQKLRDEVFLQQMKDLKADVFVVVAFRMMPQVLFEIPSKGTFNLHASLLPDYRGAAPINYAIINGENTTGVTTFFINDKIDEGAILLQEELSISPNDNAGSLHDKLMHLGSKVVLQTLDGLADNSIEAKPQIRLEHPKNAFKIFKKNTLINWELRATELFNFVRGMSPYPCAISTLVIDGDSKLLKIFEVSLENKSHSRPIGSIEFSKKEMKIYVKEGVIFLEDVQLEGKKRMKIQDFLNGLKESTNLTWG